MPSPAESPARTQVRLGIGLFAAALASLAACRPAGPAHLPSDPAPIALTVDAVALDPDGLGRIVHRELVPASPRPTEPGDVTMAPEHVRLTIRPMDAPEAGEVEPWSQSADILVSVYPFEQFATVMPDELSAEADAAATELETLLAERPASVEDALLAMRGMDASAPPGDRGREIPLLPYEASPRAVQILPRFLEFPGGAGLRFITGHRPWVPGLAMENGRFAHYVFQGLTGDRRLWVTVLAPLGHPALTKASDAAMLSSLVDPWSGNEEFNVNVGRLALDSMGFQPDLEALDHLVESIRIER